MGSAALLSTILNGACAYPALEFSIFCADLDVLRFIGVLHLKKPVKIVSCGEVAKHLARTLVLFYVEERPK